VAAVDARWSRAATRFDGNLADSPHHLEVPSPVERGASATSLEAWARCPHAYFLQQVLRVEVVEQPEDVLQITPIERGNLIHRALERFIDEAIEGGHLPAPAQPWRREDHERLRGIGEELCDQAEASGLTGRPLFWQRDRLKILADLDRFLIADDHHRASRGATPIAAELPFGRRGEAPLDYPLPDGRTVPLRGMADRVDLGADGTIHVLDYKTGKTDPYRGLSTEDPHQGGRRLQLAVYGLAARQSLGEPDARVRADYWFTSARGRFEKHGYDVDDAVIDAVSVAMGTIVEGIESGMFVAKPPAPSTSPWPECRYCDPDGLGTTELMRQWQGKLDDPALAPYLALAAPDLFDDESGDGR
jgi:RecB family exonuclease